MIQAGDFRKGTTFEMDGDVWQIIDFQHVKPGKGAAFVRTKIKSVMTGSNRDMTFNPNEKYEEARIETKEMQYLYNDGTLYYFMDPESYEQLPIDKESVEEAILYIKENDMATIKFFKGKAFQVSPPNFVELEITQTEPGIKGNTATGATKPATVETGATVNVPLFVNEGDKIKIDTRTGEYLSRV
ncbi:elongation factor P [uncultured Finegoldia sp.]|uniref:elongation factor P n=1 Tax=uncultured Finegoldia sp. TaxID=328009 RepID=UPI00261B8EF3|nr:elongation factor P [uncultured Finegoldia sp.]